MKRVLSLGERPAEMGAAGGIGCTAPEEKSRTSSTVQFRPSAQLRGSEPAHDARLEDARRYRTCENCEGEGGWEAPIPNSKWDDPTPACEWIACKYCHGSGWEEGEPEPLTQDELPDPEGDWFAQAFNSDEAWAARNSGQRERD